MSRISHQIRIDATAQLLRQIAQDYYLGCRAYHVLVEHHSPERAHFHVRLKTLAQIGAALADALCTPRPNWPVLYHIARRYRHQQANPFQPERLTDTPPTVHIGGQL